MLSIRDVLTALAEGRVQGNDSVTHLARPLYLVPGSKAVGELFGEMREEGYQMAVIVSEYGGTSGIVSIDQLVDDIVGEVKEELVPAKKAFEVVGARAYRIDGSMRIEEANEMTKKSATKTKTRKESNFSKVDRGVCPHDDKPLSDDIAGRGAGVTRKCSACEHVWYLNRKIRTSKCLTCSQAKQRTNRKNRP